MTGAREPGAGVREQQSAGAVYERGRTSEYGLGGNRPVQASPTGTPTARPDAGYSRIAVIGMGRTGEAVLRCPVLAGAEKVVVDDGPSSVARGRAADIGVALVEAPPPSELRRIVAWAELVVVSPGVPLRHPVFSLAGDAEIVSEVELASRLVDVPLVAVTGTNGKTTVATLVSAMLNQAGLRAVTAGNIGTPLISLVGTAADRIVVEVSSFQLALCSTFRPAVATWLNLSPDHLDWHPDMDHYVASKERIWYNQRGEDMAIGNAEDPVVFTALARAPARRISFGCGVGDWRIERGSLVGPDAGAFLAADDLWRSMPADRLNALAAAATAHAAGAGADAAAVVLRTFGGLPHRVEAVGTVGGITYYDDSKATTPHAVLSALSGFGSVVLLAGGRNKGLDLSVLASEAGRLRAVVCFGEAARDVAQVFAGPAAPAGPAGPVVRIAGSMEEAVRTAAGLAVAGDSVLLSPGCASFDQYGSYAERGDDFAACVRRMATEEGSP